MMKKCRPAKDKDDWHLPDRQAQLTIFRLYMRHNRFGTLHILFLMQYIFLLVTPRTFCIGVCLFFNICSRHYFTCIKIICSALPCCFPSHIMCSLIIFRNDTLCTGYLYRLLELSTNQLWMCLFVDWGKTLSC